MNAVRTSALGVIAIIVMGPTAGLSETVDLLDILQRITGMPAPDVYLWDPVEQRKIATIAWDKFAMTMDQSGIGADGGLGLDCPLPPVTVGVYCGPDVGYGQPPSPENPRCFDGTAWVAYMGAPPGSAFTSLVEGVGPAPAQCYCPGFCPPRFWDVAEMSATQNPLVLLGLIADGCYSSNWVVHADGECPNSGAGSGVLGQGVPDTFLLHWRAHGPGSAATYNFENAPDLWLDIFLGLGPVTCYDVPSGFSIGGIECPSAFGV